MLASCALGKLFRPTHPLFLDRPKNDQLLNFLLDCSGHRPRIHRSQACIGLIHG